MALAYTKPLLAPIRAFASLAASLGAASLFATALGAATFVAARACAADFGPDGSRSDRRGPYLAAGGGGILQLVPGASGSDANTFGYDLEGRLGASLNPRFQIYLSANYDSASHGAFLGPVRLFNSNFMVNLNQAFYADRDFAVYGRIGLGLGLTGANNGSATQKGLGDVFAIGFDIRLSDQTSLVPEVFYRRSNESSDQRIDSLGLQLNLVYY